MTTKNDEKEGRFSDLTFGYYDTSKFEGEISWNPIEYQYMFAVPFENIIINGKESNICENKKCLITFDSGTSLMSMPKYATTILAKKGIPTNGNIMKCKSEQ